MIDPQTVQEARDRRYRRRAELALESEEEAAQFVDDVGFCFLFPVRGTEAPTLWEAVNGASRPLWPHHTDRELSLTWEWKDSLPARKRVVYGKFLKQKPTLISLDLFACFFALSEYPAPDDWRLRYEDGKLSEDARRVYEALVSHGPLPTSILRRQAGLARRESAAHFDRALNELQRDLLIVKSGISDANRWHYCYVYETVSRWLPDEVARGQAMPSSRAKQAIAARYVETAVATTADRIARLFEWPDAEVERVVGALIGKGQLVHTSIKGWPGEWLVTNVTANRQAADL